MTPHTPRTPDSPPDTASDASGQLLSFIDASPSPWHVCAQAAQRLRTQGYTALDERARWTLTPGARHYVMRDDSALIAFVVGEAPAAEVGLRILGAHTDSPGLRLKPRPVLAGKPTRLAVDVYGGPILASFADRDLGLAGRVLLRETQDAPGCRSQLVMSTRPLLRLANLAVHMNREVNDKGLAFNRQLELPLLFGQSSSLPEEDALRTWLADELHCLPADILSWDLLAYDCQPAALWGAQQEFIASRQLDNLASCHAVLSALLATPSPSASCVVALFDHEEVGSTSASGAAGSFLDDVLQRLHCAQGLDAEDQRRALAQSFFVSTDMAHAWHPNYPNAYEPDHHVEVNGGPVIKHNVNQRYATSAASAARFMQCCERAGVPYQQYAHRSDLGCGSTIGPLLAAQLGIASVDVGSAMWAMHSARESAGAHDPAYMIAALREVLAS